LRRNPTPLQRERLLAKNGRMCCVCKADGVGLEIHHIDGDHSNTVDENLAVLCVVDHDAHHRPQEYRTRHLELGPAEILRCKTEWEDFVREAQLPRPTLLATISAYGTHDNIHSAKVVYQWTSGRIVFERVYHQLSSGNYEDWAEHIVEEASRLGRAIPLALLDEPLDVLQCPCCHKGLSNIIDRGYALRRVAPNWGSDSLASIYINPQQPSLAIQFALQERLIFGAHLHLCRGSHLHFICDEYEERRFAKRQPSIRTQATRYIDNLIRDWRPARLLIATGDEHHPQLIDNLLLPPCWEIRQRSAK
jgi:hypothetical protein